MARTFAPLLLDVIIVGAGNEHNLDFPTKNVI
jgi:hypothetical protein